MVLVNAVHEISLKEPDRISVTVEARHLDPQQTRMFLTQLQLQDVITARRMPQGCSAIRQEQVDAVDQSLFA